MKKRLLPIVLIIILFFSNINPQTIPPKREFRAAWVATVANLDWPSSNRLSVDQQKAELISILDRLKALNINVIIFQIRTECDAFYNSPYEPWSYWLTGSQGTPPSPLYDPLQFAIQEAHKRGMELHAWFNPYRAVKTVTNGNPSYPLSSNHVAVKHPDWLLKYSGEWLLDPGNPNVRKYVTDVMMDVVNRYDVDGIHWDDYFYSYGGTTTQDSASWRLYHGSFTNIGDWRRNNVNLLVQEVHDSIQAVKPWVKFGISPFGIWKSGVPTGIVGMDAYSQIYGDAVAWMQNKWLDYLTPQLYWPFGGGQDYGKLMPWWASQTNGRHLYVGEAGYRISAWSSSSEMPNHIRLSRTTQNCYGNVFFRALVGLLDNEKGFADSLKNNFYKYPALPPIMSWKDTVPPNQPQNLRYDRIASTGTAGLIWNVPQAASDGDTAVRYVIYRFNNGIINPIDLNDPRNIIDVEGQKMSIPSTPSTTNDGYYFVVTSLDRNNNESGMSSIVKVTAPQIPILASPLNETINQRDTIILKWQYPNYASSYKFQLSTDSTFNSNIVLDYPAVTDTFIVATGLLGQQKYYWRLSASNAGGTSSFSQVNSFTTGFPALPQLVNPADKTLNVKLRPDFSWNKIPSATTYRFQFAASLDFNPGSIVVDSSGILDTAYAFSKLNKDLELNKIYFWRVSATNQYGTSNWSNIFRFRTITTTDIAEQEQLPKEYELSQNYPNPFNPVTVLSYQLSANSQVTLIVYDMLGREVATLVNKEQQAGRYTVQLSVDNYHLASGIYFYQLRAGDFIDTKKMILMK
ncbi:MAG: family 10 glycosylhydrolase [Bacteroidetes bacterium]|nr:family 10 glycosylhydrolase [Bacteroidota bacterium]